MNKVIPIDIYNTDMLLVIGSADELHKSLKKYFGEEDGETVYEFMKKDLGETTCGRSCRHRGAYVMYMPHGDNRATIAHEVFHVTAYIMEAVGMSLCQSNEEAYAYLIGYLTKKIDEAITKKQ